MKIGVLGQQLQLFVEHLEALLRNIVGHDVVDRNLQVVEPGVVQALDAVGHQQISVGDHAGDHAAAADARDDQVQIGVEQRFAAADGDDVGAQIGQAVEPLVHGLDGHGLRDIVVFVAVAAGQVAAAHGNHVRQHGVIRRSQSLEDHAPFADAPVNAPIGASKLERRPLHDSEVPLLQHTCEDLLQRRPRLAPMTG